MLACGRPRPRFLAIRSSNPRSRPRVDATDPPDAARSHAVGDPSLRGSTRRQPRSVAPLERERMRLAALPQFTEAAASASSKTGETQVAYTDVYALLMKVDGVVAV